MQRLISFLILAAYLVGAGLFGSTNTFARTEVVTITHAHAHEHDERHGHDEQSSHHSKEDSNNTHSHQIDISISSPALASASEAPVLAFTKVLAKVQGITKQYLPKDPVLGAIFRPPIRA